MAVLQEAKKAPLDPLSDAESERLACGFVSGYVQDHLGRLQRTDDKVERYADDGKEGSASANGSSVRRDLLRLREAERAELLRVKAAQLAECGSGGHGDDL